MTKENKNLEELDERINFDDIFDDAADAAFTNEKEVLKTNVDAPTYELIYAQKLEENEEPLGKVIGHENQKKELLLVIDWFKRSKELKAKGVSIPKGVILFGAPGYGNSLLI